MEKLILTIALFTFISIVWGRVILFSAKNKIFRMFCFKVMGINNYDFQQVHSFLLGTAYVLSFIIAAIVCFIIYRFNVFLYFPLERQNLPYLFVGIMAELSLSGLIVACMFMFFPRIDWVNQIENIPWIQSVKLVPKGRGFLIPVIGAFCEEVFFRGYVYIILRVVFPEYGIILPLIVSALLFAIQQMLNTINPLQGLAIIAGSFAVSTIGCLLIELTGSLLPALIAHEAYVVFHFKQIGPGNKKDFVAYMDMH